MRRPQGSVGSSISNDMNISYMFCLLVYALLAPGIFAYSVSFEMYSANGGLPGQIFVGDKESMFLYWRPTEKSLTKCTVTSSTHETVDLIKGSQGNYEMPKALPQEQGFCSIRVKQVDIKSNGTWSMSAASGSKLSFSATTNVQVFPVPNIVNRTYNIIETSSRATIICGSEDAKSCRMTSPKGYKYVYYGGPCSQSISNANIFYHQGVWNCSFYMKYHTTEYTATTEVKIVEDEFKELIVKELENEIAFYCVTPKENARYVQYCKITTPYGLEMYLSPGKAYDRYTYYGSKPSECGITIPKPLEHRDMGQWRCELVQDITYNSREIYGGYKRITSDHKELALESVQVEYKNAFWSPNVPYSNYNTIKCHVPYIIEYCWMRSPNGTIYNIKDGIHFSQRNLGFKFGDCVLEVSEAEMKNATGEWTCHMGIVRESVEELSSSIHVTYSDTPLLSDEKEVSGEMKDSIRIGCRTGSGIGIKYCRFIRPDGMGLTVDPIKNNTHYSYQGDGFLYGHCGITIHSLSENDIGTWVCGVKLYGISTSTYSVSVEVKKEKGSLLALYISLGVGSLLAVLGISYFIIRKYEFKIRNRVDDVNSSLIERDEIEEETSRSNRERINNMVRFVRRRSPRPPTATPESSSSYI